MKAEFTVFEDACGYWFVPHAVEAAAIAAPAQHRSNAYDGYKIKQAVFPALKWQGELFHY